MNVGFIGVGDMGLPMVRHLLASGHSLSVWNRSVLKSAVAPSGRLSTHRPPNQLPNRPTAPKPISHQPT